MTWGDAQEGSTFVCRTFILTSFYFALSSLVLEQQRMWMMIIDFYFQSKNKQVNYKAVQIEF